MEQASRIIANRIVKQYVCRRKLIEFIIFLILEYILRAIEIKNLEKAELRTAMDILAKKELVRRIRVIDQ